MTPAADAPRRAADRLRADRDALALTVTDRMYAERPELLARYGPVGRARCLEDLGHTLDHLAPAVELDEPALFARYARWLDDLLRARRVPTADVARSFALVGAVVGERFPADEARAVAPALRAGLDALADADAGAPAGAAEAR